MEPWATLAKLIRLELTYRALRSPKGFWEGFDPIAPLLTTSPVRGNTKPLPRP